MRSILQKQNSTNDVNQPAGSFPDFPMPTNDGKSVYALRLSHKEIQKLGPVPSVEAIVSLLDRAVEFEPISDCSDKENVDQNSHDGLFLVKDEGDLQRQLLSHSRKRMKPGTEMQQHVAQSECVDEEEDDVESQSQTVSTTGVEQKESTAEISDQLGDDSSMLDTLHHNRPNRIRFTISTLPSFNLSKLITCLSVSDRLTKLCVLNKRFRRHVYEPQCFGDVSFFPVVDESDEGKTRSPKILNVHGSASETSNPIRTGITYVEVCMSSNHLFIEKVAKYAGMWNFKAELWHQVDWPTDLVMESLQLSLDPNTHVKVLDLRNELPNKSKEKIINLFLIKFEMEGRQPEIVLPKRLEGIGLQSFCSATAFSSAWWKRQLFDECIFESVYFLVLSCCDFGEGELQYLLSPNGCRRVEHLSLRYVKWEGVIDIPKTLVSLGWFPERATNFFRLNCPNKLWQLQTRLSENMDASAELLNRVFESSPDLRRISFEFIRAEEEWHANRLNCDDLMVWGGEEDEFANVRGRNMQIVVDPNQWRNQPGLDSVFASMVENKQFIHPNQTHFLDCPKWSEDARNFIRMTMRRKLLLR